MRIGILADTHNQFDRTERALAVLKEVGVSAYFHCGDLTSPSMVRLFAGLPAFFALGNNDVPTEPIQKAIREIGGTNLGEGGIVEVGGLRIALSHGHLKSKVKALLAESPDLMFLGHSHRRREEKVGKTLVVNPGALHRVKQFSVAWIDCETLRVNSIELSA